MSDEDRENVIRDILIAMARAVELLNEQQNKNTAAIEALIITRKGELQ